MEASSELQMKEKLFEVVVLNHLVAFWRLRVLGWFRNSELLCVDSALCLQSTSGAIVSLLSS